MPCDTRLRPGQTIQQRATEVRDVVSRLERMLSTGNVKVVVDRKSGAIAFNGVSDSDRNNVTDACMYRRIMATGTAAAKLAIQRAETVAGRGVSRQAIGQGVHSHDGGHTWHGGH